MSFFHIKLIFESYIHIIAYFIIFECIFNRIFSHYNVRTRILKSIKIDTWPCTIYNSVIIIYGHTVSTFRYWPFHFPGVLNIWKYLIKLLLCVLFALYFIFITINWTLCHECLQYKYCYYYYCFLCGMLEDVLYAIR